MYVLRGRPDDLERDRSVAQRMLEVAAQTGQRGVRVWIPHPHVSFGPRDARHAAYQRAVKLAEARGLPAVERSVGGHPVAHTGGTLAFATTTAIDDPRRGMQARYEAALIALEAAMDDLGVSSTRGEPPGAFCPGSHSLSASGKIVGIAQRIVADAALVSGVVVVTDHDRIANVLGPIYAALDLQFDPDAVGSVARAGGPADPRIVAQTIQARLLDGADATEALGIDDFLSRRA